MVLPTLGSLVAGSEAYGVASNRRGRIRLYRTALGVCHSPPNNYGPRCLIRTVTSDFLVHRWIGGEMTAVHGYTARPDTFVWD
jgi:hypothetical protein